VLLGDLLKRLSAVEGSISSEDLIESTRKFVDDNGGLDALKLDALLSVRDPELDSLLYSEQVKLLRITQQLGEIIASGNEKAQVRRIAVRFPWQMGRENSQGDSGFGAAAQILRNCIEDFNLAMSTPFGSTCIDPLACLFFRLSLTLNSMGQGEYISALQTALAAVLAGSITSFPKASFGLEFCALGYECAQGKAVQDQNLHVIRDYLAQHAGKNEKA